MRHSNVSSGGDMRSDHTRSGLGKQKVDTLYLWKPIASGIALARTESAMQCQLPDAMRLLIPILALA